MRTSLLAVGLLVTMLTTASAHAAEPSEGGAAAAESLFQEGRRAMEAKRYGEACPKFLASYKLSPAIGTLLNLADCYEKNGQLASAWARFHEAVGLAARLGRADRERTARERAEKLEPRMIRLTILAQEPQIEVKLDGNAIDSAVLGAPIPIDPGKHTIEASAKGKRPFTTSIDVSDRTKSPSVELPELEPIKEPVPTTTKKELPVTTPPEEPHGSGGTQRVLGLLAIGVGVAGLGVGGYFGYRASSTWSDAQTHCRGIDCDRTGVDLAGRAKTSGNISTIAFIAGGVLVAGGTLLFFTAPSSKAAAGRSLDVGIGPREVVVRGSF